MRQVFTTASAAILCLAGQSAKAALSEPAFTGSLKCFAVTGSAEGYGTSKDYLSTTRDSLDWTAPGLGSCSASMQADVRANGLSVTTHAQTAGLTPPAGTYPYMLGEAKQNASIFMKVVGPTVGQTVGITVDMKATSLLTGRASSSMSFTYGVQDYLGLGAGTGGAWQQNTNATVSKTFEFLTGMTYVLHAYSYAAGAYAQFSSAATTMEFSVRPQLTSGWSEHVAADPGAYHLEFSAAPVPEPASAAMLLLGLAGLGAVVRKSRRG